ncbi:asparaginase [Nitriliruptoraceae bacterium ZYF776]|nr:asparaginase [Profundirhabdus halotolerans]
MNDRHAPTGGRPARVAVVTTGGTISSRGHHPGDLTDYMTSGQHAPADELVAAATPGVGDVEVVAVDLGATGGPGIDPRAWLRLHAHLRELAPTVDGLVVTHGTNTLEETALFLRLTWPHDTPVVLTGAMRPAGAHATDGPGNLAAAVRVAASPASRGRGVQVVIGTRIFDARHVTKTSGEATDAFAAGDQGPVGFAELHGPVRYLAAPFAVPTTAIDHLDVAAGELLPRVDVVVSHVGADGAAVDAHLAAGSRALVLAGTGSGHPGHAERDALDRAADHGVLRCRATRTGGGVVAPHPLYPGWLAAGRLTPWAARTALSVLLTRTDDVDELQDLLDRIQWLPATPDVR